MRPAQRLITPSAWPITGKLVFAFVLTGLIPIFLTAYYGYRDSLNAIRDDQRRMLRQLATTTAARLDLQIGNAAKTLSLLQRAQEITELAAASNPAPRKPGAVRRLQEVAASNGDFEWLAVTDSQGKVLAASGKAIEGVDLSSLPGLAAAKAGKFSISPLERGLAAERPGVYLAAPVSSTADPGGQVVAVVVAKVVEKVVRESVQQYGEGAALESYLVNGAGVVMLHPDSRWLGRSMASLPLGSKDGSREVAELVAARLVDAGEAGWIEHAGIETSKLWVTAYAPLLSQNWVLAVSQPTDVVEQPLQSVFQSVFGKVILVAIFAGLFALVIFSRDLVWPIRSLIASARRVEAGDYANARALRMNEDEIGALADTFNTMVDAIQQRERERDMFGRMVSPEVREKLLSGQLKLGGESREVAVLFCDIRDFTTLCEGLPPEAVVEMLNEYFSAMTKAVQPWSGYVNNFMGDAIMVIFGAPYQHPEPAWGAVQAAFDMREQLDELNRKRAARGAAPIAHGIAISLGEVIAGQMGSLERFQYTVIGDAVNVAARLEGLTKDFADNPILATDAVVVSIRDHYDVAVRTLGTQVLKGRSQETEIFAVARKKVWERG